MPLKGIAELPLHYGHMPRWLYKNMVELAGAISKLLFLSMEKKKC